MRALAVVILVAGFILGGWASAAAETSAPAERAAKVAADRLNLRASPSTTADVVSSLSRDDAVTVLEEQGEWYRLKLADGRTGWAAKKYIQIISEAPTETSETPGSEPAARPAKEAMQPRTESHGGGGSFLGAVFKWGCLLGAGASGYLAYHEHTQGNDSYDQYKTEYNRLIGLGQGHDQALDGAEHLRTAAVDHDKKAQTYSIVAGGLGAAFLVQVIFFHKHHDESSRDEGRTPDQPLLACGLRQGQLRAAVTLARF